jgi:hypothetical protein
MTCWFSEKINKINKHFPKLYKPKRPKTQINEIRDQKGHTIKSNNEIQRIIKEYLKNFLINWKMEKKLLDIYELPKLNQKAINHLNIAITSNEIEAVLVFQQTKAQT